ncbi:MAG: Uncharacterized protein FD147_364 [Chloroflexi bacterium]|nr:MAG: Uncharacterized protein FD147_364 [Chloroflexota bacterium]MBA4375205.1 hypothetical protein [Anaerolinea sp.]
MENQAPFDPIESTGLSKPNEDQDNSPVINRLQSMPGEVEHIEAELRLTLEEIARLQNSLAEANMKIMALQKSPAVQSNSVEGDEILQPVLKELKQPIHTIKGYMDLLLNESVGILGTFQKRFLERISNSVDHMETLLNGLERVPGEDVNNGGLFTQVFSTVDVTEDSLSLFTDQIRKKRITLRVEFAETVMELRGDKELFEHILNILITNACSSIEPEGTVSISLKELNGKDPKQILFSIQAEDAKSAKGKPQPVILEEFKDQEIKLLGFSSPLKDLIKAKILVEEMHGKMDVFSTPGSGSIIRVRLPISAKESLV